MILFKSYSRLKTITIINIKQDDNETYSQCTRYDINWTDPAIIAMDLLLPNSSWPVVPCDHGWEYDTSEVVSSIVVDVRICNFN